MRREPRCGPSPRTAPVHRVHTLCCGMEDLPRSALNLPRLYTGLYTGGTITGWAWLAILSLYMFLLLYVILFCLSCRW